MLLIRNANIKTMAGPDLKNGCLLLENGKIAAVGQTVDAPEGVETLDAQGRLLTPGCVEAHCHIGLDNEGMRWEGMDYNEIVEPLTPQLRAIDSINPQDEAFGLALRGGVTTACTGPGSANVVGGTFAIVKLAGKRVDRMILRAPAAMKCAFGENPKGCYGHDKRQSPMTRMAVAALLRELLLRTLRYRDDKAAGKNPAFDMKLEAMLPVVNGEIPLKCHAHRADDILTAVRIAREFGLKLTLDLKRGVDADKLMAKLFKTTPLEDSFSANFNILVAGQPRVMGVREILQEWTAFRVECVRRRTYYDLHGKEKRLHLLQGLAAILLDIDKAIKIIRTTEEESEVVPNLMIGFGIDEVQADYVAEIKLRHLNREYILKRTSEIEQLEKDIADLNDVLAKPARVRRIIINELNEVAKKYAQPRRSEILYDLPEEEAAAEEETVPDYPVTVFFTREGYLKKIPPQSLRTAGAHKLKEGDEIVQQVETRNNVEALFFTDKQQVYKVRLAELEDGKVAQMGIFVPGRLGMDEGENILAMVITGDYSGFVLFFFASGKCAKIPLSSYATKQNRRKLLKAYCDKEPLAKLLYLPEETELAIRTSTSRMLLVGTAQIAAKATRDSQGVAVVTLKKNQTIASVVPADTLELANPHRYRVRSLPATGALIRAEDEGEQMSLL